MQNHLDFASSDPHLSRGLFLERTFVEEALQTEEEERVPSTEEGGEIGERFGLCKATNDHATLGWPRWKKEKAYNARAGNELGLLSRRRNAS